MQCCSQPLQTDLHVAAEVSAKLGNSSMEAAAIFRGNGAPHTSDVPDIPQMQPHTHQAQELLQELQHETPPAVDLHVLSLEKTPHGNVHPGQSGTLLHDLSDATIRV